MILTGNRQEEILTRAKNRTVSAIIHMSAPDIDPNINPSQFGMIVENKKPVHSLTSKKAFAQGAQSWVQDDTCVTLAEKDPKVLYEILEAVGRRMKSIEGELQRLHGDDKKVIFNSEDLVNKATGIPLRMRFNLNESENGLQRDILKLPFNKLQSYLLTLQEKLENIGGKIHSVDVAHTASMTAFEYYELATKTLVPGRKFSYGDIMLSKAYNLLKDIGMPLVEARKPTLN